MAQGWRREYGRYKDYFLNIVNLYKQRSDLRAFLEIILSLSTITIFALFALKPTAVTIIGLVNEIKDKKNTLAGLNQKIDNLGTARNVYSGSQTQIQNIDAALSTAPQPNVFARQIEGLVSKDAVNVLGISVGEITLYGKDPQIKKSNEAKQLPGNAKEMPISLNVSGNYSALTNFIRDLESLRIPIKIDVLTINSSLTDLGQIIVAAVSGRVPYIGE